MCIGADEGCHEVPDAIAPIDIRFVSLAPTRILISLSVITNNGPMFMEPIPCLFSMPGIFPIAPGEGLGEGIGMFIGVGTDREGFGETGIGIPGISVIGGVGAGDGFGVDDCFAF